MRDTSKKRGRTYVEARTIEQKKKRLYSTKLPNLKLVKTTNLEMQKTNPGAGTRRPFLWRKKRQGPPERNV